MADFPRSQSNFQHWLGENNFVCKQKLTKSIISMSIGFFLHSLNSFPILSGGKK